MKPIIWIVLASLMFISACGYDGVENKSAENSVVEKEQVSKIPTPEDGELVLPQKPIIVESPNTAIVPKPKCDVFETTNLPSKKGCEILSKLFPDALFTEGVGSNTLIVKAKLEDIRGAKRLLKMIDKKTSQIMIESKVLEISESALNNMGVSWGNTSGAIKVAIDTNSGKVNSENISVYLNALLSKGEARVIANPRISTLDNSEATVNIGSKIPYAVPVSSGTGAVQWAVQYIDAGVSLKITPRLGNKGVISVLIHPEVSSISEWRTTPAGEFPVISTRNADAFVRVRNGETIIIGGLIDSSERENMSKIPFAGDLPFLKEFFTKRTTEKIKTEVVFMITPHVM